jgi:hypothetical protein
MWARAKGVRPDRKKSHKSDEGTWVEIAPAAMGDDVEVRMERWERIT